MSSSPAKLNSWMEEALIEARKARDAGEVPVGAVVVQEGAIISRAHNLVESLNDATAHAELLALRQAAQLLGRWRLNDCQLVVTLEPCTMCMAATRLHRVNNLVFGASDERFGAVNRTRDISTDSQWGPIPTLVAGLQDVQAIELMQSFFRGLRQ